MFEEIYQRDSLRLWAAGNLNHKRVMAVAGLTKDHVAGMARVTKSLVRFNSRNPADVHKGLEQVAQCCLLVADHFDDKAHWTSLWFRTPNPLLGDIAPRDMIRYRRIDKLQRHIVAALVEDQSTQSTKVPRVAPPP